MFHTSLSIISFLFVLQVFLPKRYGFVCLRFVTSLITTFIEVGNVMEKVKALINITLGNKIMNLNKIRRNYTFSVQSCQLNV